MPELTPFEERVLSGLSTLEGKMDILVRQYPMCQNRFTIVDGKLAKLFKAKNIVYGLGAGIIILFVALLDKPWLNGLLK